MSKRLILFIPFMMLLITTFNIMPATSQQKQGAQLREKALCVFLDISRRYESHFKRKITFVNYMRDRQQAQLYIMMTSQNTGSNGRRYTIVLYGQEKFVGENDTLIYHSRQSDTSEMTRDGLLKKLKLGLMKYVAKTPVAENIEISYKQDNAKPDDVRDRWNHWVFNIDVDTDVDGEESRQNHEIGSSFSADRVTDNWKMSFNINGDYEEDHYQMDSGDILSISKSWGTRALIVKSFGPHWSLGGYASTRSSTYSNIHFATEIAPAIEYNIFPYSESTYREFRLLYKNGFKSVKYREMTIYDKLEEQLWYESLRATFEIKERWGSINFNLSGSHYFHDFSKNHFAIFSSLHFRIFEGLSFNIRARAARIHDQLSLECGEASEQDILLHRKEIATQYDYSFSVGFRYTFGSIFSNIVNPRFGNRRH
ncbi:hypothetical protein KAR48_08140 [bacterium]|nr:hypothetical protein [bacterium]